MPYLLKDNQPIAITIDPSQEIGSGGMGVVYRIGNVLGGGNLVAKIFKNPTDPKNPSQAKLQAMIARPPEHVYEVINGVGYTQFAWVQDLIVADDGQLIGYAMPELDFDHSLSLNPFMYPREAHRLTDYQNSLNYRVQLGANISALMADLHAHGHAFIDFKEQNLRLLPEPKTGVNDEFKGFIVGFIDCDSFRVTGADGTVYPSPVISPEMTSPEYHEHKTIALLDEKHDRFVLAIELFKILNYGIHPFYFIPLSERLKNAHNRNTDQFIKERLYGYGITPHPEIAPLKNSIHACWDDVTRAMFDQAFLSPNPNDRPTAQAWETHFRQLIHDRDFVACQNFPDDISHIHFVGKPCHRCLWLTTEKRPQVNHNQPTKIDTVDNIWRNVNTNVNITVTPDQAVTPATSPWQSATNNHNATDIANQHQITSTNHADSSAHVKSINSPNQASLEQNRAWEQSIQQTNYTNHGNTAPADKTSTSPTQLSQAVDTHHSSKQSIAPTSSVHGKPSQSASKKWLIPIMAGVVGIGGYVAVHQPNSQNHRASANAERQSNNADNTDGSNTATARGTNKNSNNATAYQTTINHLPAAKATIDKELASQSKGGFFSTSTDSLYQDSLGFSSDFLAAVKQTAKQGEPQLSQLINTANTHDIDGTMAMALKAFREADMGFFASQPVNKNLAKQYNESAKNYYWNKKDPKAALYLQAQAVKNQPTQGEYVANLAFYLVKNNYPNAKDFVLYALQTPRDANKYPNTYMIELASALAVKDGNQAAAVGALLAQYYTADDRAKRCQNMLKYPQTYPELVPIAEKVLMVIDEQNNSGEMPSPNACKPPFNWVG